MPERISTRHWLWWPARILTAVALLALIAWGARFPLGKEPVNGALLLDWRNVGQRMQVCREYTADEVRSLPAHMRRGRHCENRLLPYQLRVWIDGSGLLDSVVQPAGLRGDRPLTVSRSFPLEPGTYRLRVEYGPYDSVTREEAEARNQNAKEDAALEQALASATRYVLDEDVRISAGGIILVTLHEDARTLVLEGQPASPQQ